MLSKFGIKCSSDVTSYKEWSFCFLDFLINFFFFYSQITPTARSICVLSMRTLTVFKQIILLPKYGWINCFLQCFRASRRTVHVAVFWQDCWAYRTAEKWIMLEEWFEKFLCIFKIYCDRKKLQVQVYHCCSCLWIKLIIKSFMCMKTSESVILLII